MKKVFVVLSTLIALSGCALINGSPKELASKNALTPGQITLTLKKNVTTQSEVLEKFGSPNVVTNTADGSEIWTYQKQATIASSNSNSLYATIILLGGESKSSGFEQTSRTMTLIIKFKEIDGVKTVYNFSSRYSEF